MCSLVCDDLVGLRIPFSVLNELFCVDGNVVLVLVCIW